MKSICVGKNVCPWGQAKPSGRLGAQVVGGTGADKPSNIKKKKKYLATSKVIGISILCKEY